MKNSPKLSFKGTEIGLTPEDWEVVKLGEVCKITTGKKDVNQGNPNGIYPFFTCSRKITYSDTYSFDTEAILIAGNGDVGLTKYYKGKFEVYQRTYVLYDFRKDVKFIFYFILSGLKKKLIKDKSGSTMPYVRKGDLSSFQISLPPLPEQRKISRVLSKMQQAIEQQDKIIDATKNLKKSLMQKLFTEGIGHTEFKETEIGQIPKSWEVVKLGAVAEVKYGYSTRIPKVSEKGGTPIISMADITPEGKILWDKIRMLNVNDKVITNHKLSSGEVLFNWRNSPKYVGKTAVFDRDNEIPYICASFLLRITTKPSALNNKFLHCQLSFMRMKGYFSQKSRRAVGQTNFNASVLKNMYIFLPLLPEQQQIAQTLCTVDKKIEIEEKRKNTLKELFKTLLHKLMTGEIRLKNIEV